MTSDITPAYVKVTKWEKKKKPNPEQPTPYSLTQGVLLKTAITNVRAGDKTTEANILLDEGAQTSFITEALADKLNLKTRGEEEVQLNSFGDNGRQVSRMKTATVYLQTDEGEEIGINILVIPQIAAPIRTHIKSVSNMPHLHDLKLAHPASAGDLFDINVLIGADHYWDIVGDKVIRGNGPTAMESKLGYLLSGPITQRTTASSMNSVMNVTVTHETNKPENYETMSFQDIVYMSKRQRKRGHRLLPVNETVAAQRTGNGSNIKVGDAFVHDDKSRTSRARNVVDISNVGENRIERSAVRTNGLVLHKATTLYPIDGPPDDVDAKKHYSSDNDCEKMCQKAKRGPKVKFKK